VTPPAEKIRTRPDTSRRPKRRGHRSPRQNPAVDPLAAERRLRAAGGPLDQARYHCACNFAFLAAVSTTVACPHCGTRQSW